MDEETRRAKLAEIARKKVVFRLPDMDAVAVRRDIAYRTTADGSLLMDIYSARGAGARAPVVVIVLGFPDPQSSIRTYGPITSWARLIAASGMTAVIYGSSAPAEDVHAVLRYLRDNAGSLDIDEQRIGLFSMSGSVPVALAALMRDDTLNCAALPMMSRAQRPLPTGRGNTDTSTRQRGVRSRSCQPVSRSSSSARGSSGFPASTPPSINSRRTRWR
jgi:acetyl esterase/lipase